MATTHVYKDVKLYTGAYDISGASNEAELGYEFEEVDNVHFGDDCRFSLPGFPKMAWTIKGHAYSDGTDEVEDVLYGQHGVVDVPMTFCPTGDGAAGSVGYFAEATQFQHQFGGAVGAMYPFSASGQGRDTPLIRGTVIENGTKTSTGSGTARQLGAVTATQYLYGCLHVIGPVAGTLPTLDLLIQSDDAEGFASPTTRLTFTQKTAIGSQFITPVAGAITDTWWRASWTIGGSGGPSFPIVVVVGIATP